MDVLLLTIPYDTARHNYRMGAGPKHLVNSGLIDRVRSLHHKVVTEAVHPQTEPLAEIRTAFELMERVARKVRTAALDGKFPLILSGNCNIAVGAVSALPHRVGVVWFDAHADFCTPETSTSGFLDGMALATLVGRCWQPLANGIPQLHPVSESNVLLIGAREIEDAELTSLDASEIVRVSVEAAIDGSTLDDLVWSLSGRVDGIYVHIDLDVLDVRVGRANGFAAAGGLTVKQLREAVVTVARNAPIFAIGIASYDPAFDATGSIARAATEVLTSALRAISGVR